MLRVAFNQVNLIERNTLQAATQMNGFAGNDTGKVGQGQRPHRRLLGTAMREPVFAATLAIDLASSSVPQDAAGATVRHDTEFKRLGGMTEPFDLGNQIQFGDQPGSKVLSSPPDTGPGARRKLRPVGIQAPPHRRTNDRTPAP